MPPRHSYWTIILEGKPTAFRAHTNAELLPTFKQLQSKHPDIVMKWYSRGRLWSSPEEEQAAVAAREPERRNRAWRPGGTHEDPRERFKIPRDEKRRRFADRLRRDRRDERAGEGPPRPDRKPGGERTWRPEPPKARPANEPGDRRPEWRGPRSGQARHPGGRWPGSTGFDRRGPGGRGPGAQGPGDRGSAGRPPENRGPGGRGPGGRPPAGRRPGGHRPGGRGPGGRKPGGGGPGGRGPGGRGPGGGQRGGGGHGR